MPSEKPEIKILTPEELIVRAAEDKKFQAQVDALNDDGQRLPEGWGWADAVKIEPRLAELENDALALANSGRSYSITDVFYNQFKERVCDLSGYDASHIALRSEAAYDLVYGHIYDILNEGATS